MTAIHRRTARVIPVSPQGSVLLLRGHDPLRPDAPYWFTVGGGIESGESEAQAAQRELWEETGIDRPIADLGEAVHEETHSYHYNGVEIRANSVFFALSMTEEVDVRPAASIPGEIITDGRWWHPEVLAQLPLTHPDLSEIAASAVRSLNLY